MASTNLGGANTVGAGTGSVLARQLAGDPARIDAFRIGAPVTIETLLLVSFATPRGPGSRRSRPA